MIDEKSFDKDKIGIPNIDILDPLGEIRRCARELWQKDGMPSDKDVRYYWEKAEQLMVGPNKTGS